jgi:hypothetical protein
MSVTVSEEELARITELVVRLVERLEQIAERLESRRRPSS